MPPDGAPVVDVEAYIGRTLIGGFRKEYHPPVPVHQPRDPVYAESEIFVDPYPTQIGLPTLLGAIVYNPTSSTQRVTVRSAWRTLASACRSPRRASSRRRWWLTCRPWAWHRSRRSGSPTYRGLFCVQVELQSAGHDPVWSRRNIDVGEPLKPDLAHERIVEVRNPLTQTATIVMALINHRPEWQAIAHAHRTDRRPPGVVREVDAHRQAVLVGRVADEEPVVDVEAYIDGELIGGIRKIARPPIPLHRPQDQPYAESEISVTPYPLVAGQPATIATEIVNTSEETQTIRVLVRRGQLWLWHPVHHDRDRRPHHAGDAGAGPQPDRLDRVDSAEWRALVHPDPPPGSEQRGGGAEEPAQRGCGAAQCSGRVSRSPKSSCCRTRRRSRSPSPSARTRSTCRPGWTYSTSPTETVLGPYQSVTVTLTITPPCDSGLTSASLKAMLDDAGGGNSPAEINVEGYTNGQMIVDGAGIQIQFDPVVERKTYLPIVLKR